MGLVSQDPVFLKGSIRANIANVEEGIANEIEVTNAHRFVIGLQLVSRAKYSPKFISIEQLLNKTPFQ